MSIWAWSCWGCFLITYFCDLDKQHFFCPWFDTEAGKCWDLSLVLGHRRVKVCFFRWYNICFFKYLEQRNFNLYKFQRKHCEGLQLSWRQLVAEGWQATRLSLLDMDGEIRMAFEGKTFRPANVSWWSFPFVSVVIWWNLPVLTFHFF